MGKVFQLYILDSKTIHRNWSRRENPAFEIEVGFRIARTMIRLTMSNLRRSGFPSVIAALTVDYFAIGAWLFRRRYERS